VGLSLASGLIGWLYGRRKSRLISSVVRHLELATRCVEDIAEATHKALNDEDIDEILELLNEREKEADRYRREIIYELARSELTAEDKDDLSHLVKRVDMIADYARGAGRILAILPKLGGLPIELRSCISNMAELLVKCSQATRRCVETLLEDKEKALKYADKVEEAEEEVDEAYGKCRRLIVDGLDALPASCIVFLSQFLDALENTADSCEDTVDQVRVIAIHIS
jgi:predicted phosphate transport protein (TIGR00153 family)